MIRSRMTKFRGYDTMEDNNFIAERLNIWSVFRVGLYVCKQNYKTLLQICFFSFLIFLFNTLQSYAKVFMTPGIATILYNIISFVIFFPIAYLDMKLSVTLWIAISKGYKGEPVSIKEAFSLSARTTWAYIGTSILFSLMIVPIVLLFTPIFLMIQVGILRWALILLLAIVVIYLGIVYGFAPTAAALEGANESNFKLSKKLVKIDFVRVAIIETIINIILFSTMLTSSINPLFKALNHTNQIVVQIGYHFIYMFISPLMGALSIVLYLTLRNKVTLAQSASEVNAIQE